MPPDNKVMPANLPPLEPSVLPTPIVAPVPITVKKSPLTGILTMLLILTALLSGYFYTQIPKEAVLDVSPTPTISVTPTVITTTIVATLPVTSSVTPTPSVASGKATISGTLGYPAGSLPTMSVCAVDSVSDKETCVKTKANQDTYKLLVDPGTYIVYAKAIHEGAKSNYRSYYTKCDTYKDSFIPECNPNADPASGINWDNDTFKCFNDAVCKAAFTPLAVTVKAEEKKTLQRILQGWYIPCSYDGATCNSSAFDVWKDYLPK